MRIDILPGQRLIVQHPDGGELHLIEVDNSIAMKQHSSAATMNHSPEDDLNPVPLWRQMIGAHVQYTSLRKSYAAEIRVIAAEIERRADLGLELDPTEVVEWLRDEAQSAEGLTPLPDYLEEGQPRVYF